MDWRSQLQGMRGLRTPSRPETPALLVIDMQRYFCESGAPAYDPRFEAVIPNVQRLIDHFQDRRLPVFATRYYSSSHHDPVVRWWGTELRKESRWFQLDDRLELGESVILDKDLYGTFSSTDIDTELRMLGCDTVVICGVMTDLCCETTAREAFQEGYDVIFCADAAGTSNDLLQLGTLAGLAHGFAYIMDTSEIVDVTEGR